MPNRRDSGFTLVELVVAMAVAGILLGVGVPSFAEAVRNSRISTQYNAVVAALYLARSEAVKSAELVTVCARATDTSCGNDWSNGWITFVDPSATSLDTAASIDSNDTVLRIDAPLKGDNTIVAYSVTSSGTGVAENASSFVRYQPRGDAHWKRGTFRICDAKRGAGSSRAVNVVLTGDIRPGRKSGTPAVAQDVANRPIECTVAST